MKEILCGYHIGGKFPKGEFKGSFAALLILIREYPLPSISALPLSL
jgi:hypothetical protein